MSGAVDTTPPGGAGRRRAHRQSFMERIEERWRRRNDER
jgi:hypothetical protein